MRRLFSLIVSASISVIYGFGESGISWPKKQLSKLSRTGSAFYYGRTKGCLGRLEISPQPVLVNRPFWSNNKSEGRFIGPLKDLQ